MEQRAPLWRPLLMVAIGYAYWIGRQSSTRLETRSWMTYAIVATMLIGCGVQAWGIQRWRGRCWPWFIEMFVVLGLLFAAAATLNFVLPLLLP